MGLGMPRITQPSRPMASSQTMHIPPSLKHNREAVVEAALPGQRDHQAALAVLVLEVHARPVQAALPGRRAGEHEQPPAPVHLHLRLCTAAPKTLERYALSETI